jgi:hypothetical protein
MAIDPPTPDQPSLASDDQNPPAGNAKKDLAVFAAFDGLLHGKDYDTGPWLDGQYVADIGTLFELFQTAIGSVSGLTQQSGRAAASLDAWIAYELRRAGFDADDVWPRMRDPRVLPNGLGPLERRIELIGKLLAEAEQSGKWGSNLRPTKPGAQLTPATLRAAIVGLSKDLPGGSMRDSRLLGQFYTKQVDVLVSSWRHGADVIVSSKTMFSSYNNNRNNRYEETLGEATNLRARYPLAATGYAFLLRSDVHNDDRGQTFRRMRDLVARLRHPDGPYDATMLLIGDWDEKTGVLSSVGLDPAASHLGPDQFFEDLTGAVLNRSPVDEHEKVRRRRGDA